MLACYYRDRTPLAVLTTQTDRHTDRQRMAIHRHISHVVEDEKLQCVSARRCSEAMQQF